MFLTNVLLKKAKAKYVLVLLRSTTSNHVLLTVRERLGEKKEMIFYDPLTEMECLYKEQKKIKSIRNKITPRRDLKEHTYGTILE